MKRAVAPLLGATACLVLVSAVRRYAGRTADVPAVRASLVSGSDSLERALGELSRALRAHDSARVRTAFRVARERYKRIEGAMEFYAPALASAFNARRQEVDDDDAPPPSMLAPSGFPALERLIWPALAAPDSAANIVEGMRPLARRMHTFVADLSPTRSQLYEIARLELARVSILGIAGFDAPLSHDAIPEAAAALDGVRSLIAAESPAIDASLARAAAELRTHPDFERFNRLRFIVGFVEPAARQLDAFRRAMAIDPIRIPRAWRADVASPYLPNAFDSRAYAPTTSPAPSPELIALGKHLFADPSLSGTGTRSCASCHQPSRAFADGISRAASLDQRTPVARNTPTLINAGLQPSQFADERSVTLEDQVVEVLRSVSEMSSSIDRAAATAHVTPLELRQALAAYVRSLSGLASRFDRALAGDTLALSSEERDGFRLFMGKAGCGTCHFAPLFNGATPPLYLSSDVEVIGTTRAPNSRALDPDSGRARIDHLPLHYRAFKTPSLRNVSVTAPYMHNGTFRTLDDVMGFYDAGGGAGLGARIPNQTLPADSLHLSRGERQAIVAFLGALTDTTASRRP